MLPRDATAATLVGRVWDSSSGGPRVVLVRGDNAVDISDEAQTMSGLLERPNPAEFVHDIDRTQRNWRLHDLMEADSDDESHDHLLSPIDLQVIKACGVTFADSMIERLIEERAGGDPALAATVRADLTSILGVDVTSVTPGSPEAAQLKVALQTRGLWSQYLEVGIGADPEVFTKAPVLSSVGFGAKIGVPHYSSWTNSEPELVLVVDSNGTIRGATLGNDVNLRDIEGRSALLLGMAKDTNASTAIGPFIRLFDEAFTLENLRTEQISMRVTGPDGYVLDGINSLSRISRSFESLVSATCGPHHQYPDGFALFTGTLFAPTQDRDEPGQGFTHKVGDSVSISSDHLGSLLNEVGHSEEIPPWTFGLRRMLDWLTSGSALRPVSE